MAQSHARAKAAMFPACPVPGHRRTPAERGDQGQFVGLGTEMSNVNLEGFGYLLM
jgi:hypothetical protein